MAITEKTIRTTTKYEGNFEHMYLDTKGNVTVGIGHMIPSADAAVSLPFVHRADRKPATAEEKKAEWSSMHAQTPAKVATYYAQFSTMILLADDIKKLFMSDAQSFDAQLHHVFPEYDKYPIEVQEGLFDMIYNLGIGNLRDHFGPFVAAVQAKEWYLAASTSRRADVQKERNDDIRALFEEAGKKAKTLEGNWSGTVMPLSGEDQPITMTLVLRKTGSTAFSGSVSCVVDGKFETLTLPSVGYTPPSTISFQFEGLDVRASLSDDGLHLKGTFTEDGELAATFDFVRH
jgi:GH24 family phage-related lysozyme (muramidase)